MRRSPRGERGLKLDKTKVKGFTIESLPTRGAWIEITLDIGLGSPAMSLPTRGAWIEIRRYYFERKQILSLPTRGAWIEIPSTLIPCLNKYVAPHAGSVD